MSPKAKHSDPKLADQIRVLAALDNPHRLRAFRIIEREQGVSFARIAHELGIPSGLAAYHMGILKAAGLVDVSYERRAREVSQYILTKHGKVVYDSLLRVQEKKASPSVT